MKTNLISALIAIAISSPIAFMLAKSQIPTPKKYIGETELREIILKKEFEGTRIVLNDVYPVHRRNQANRPIIALYEIPVEVAATVDLSKMKISTPTDDMVIVNLPEPRLSAPVFRWSEANFEDLRRSNISVSLFRNHMEEALLNIRDIEEDRKEKIQQAAINAGIIQLTRMQLIQFFEAVFLPLDQGISVTFYSEDESATVQPAHEDPTKVINALENRLIAFDEDKDIGVDF